MSQLNELAMVATIAMSLVATMAVAGLVLVIVLRPKQDTKAILEVAWLAAETHDRGFRRGLERESDEPVAEQPSLLDRRPAQRQAPEPDGTDTPFQHPDEVELGSPSE